MPTTCVFILENNPMKVIYTGQLLRGIARITLTNGKTVRGIYVNIYGTAHAKWSKSAGKSRIVHTGDEDYLNERTYFVGGPSGNAFYDLLTERLFIL